MKLFRIVNQALLISLAGAILIAVFFYVLTASSPLLGDITWGSAAKFGAIWWLTTFGGQIAVGAGSVSLIPLFFTLLVAAGIYFPLKRAEIRRWNEVAGATFSGTILVGIVGLLTKAAGPWWIAIIGTAIMCFVLAFLAGFRQLIKFETIPLWGIRAGTILRWLLIIYLVATLITLSGFLIFGMSNAVQIQRMFNQGVLGNTGLVIVQLLYFPVLLIWAGVWMVGGKVILGTGSFASILGSKIGLLPAIPAFGLIPGPNFGQPWMAVIPISVFFLAGVVLVRMLKVLHTDFRLFCAASIAAHLVSVLLIELIGVLGSGAIGAGRMAEFGPIPVQFVFSMLLLFALPSFAGMLLAHPLTWVKLRQLTGNVKQNMQDHYGQYRAAKNRSNQDKTEEKEQDPVDLQETRVKLADHFDVAESDKISANSEAHIRDGADFADANTDVVNSENSQQLEVTSDDHVSSKEQTS